MSKRNKNTESTKVETQAEQPVETPEVTLEQASEGVSQQDLIRRLFLSGATRAEIHKALGIRYQIVYKATNPEFAPNALKDVIEVELAHERALKA